MEFKMGKSIAAVIVGFIVWSVLHFGNMTIVQSVWADAIGEDGSCFETVPLAVMLCITIVQSIAAGFVCRLIAKKGKAPLGLAITLFAVGAAIEGLGWGLAPAWYHIVFLVMLVPMTLFGAALATKKAA
jgi:hypothetical protein